MIDLGVYDAMRDNPKPSGDFWELQAKKRALRDKIVTDLGFNNILDIPEKIWPSFEKLYSQGLKKLK